MTMRLHRLAPQVLFRPTSFRSLSLYLQLAHFSEPLLRTETAEHNTLHHRPEQPQV